jgi:Flp pilus assembly protein TadB
MTGPGWLAAVLLAGAAALLLPVRASPPVPTRGAPVAPGAGEPSGRRRALVVAAVGLGAALLLGGTVGLLAGGAAAVVAWVVTGRMEPREVRLRRERLAAGVPHVVDLLAAALAVGLSPSTAVAQVARAVDPPIRDELAALDARLRLGADPVDVWRDLAGHPQLGGLGRCVVRASDSGASVADAMFRLAGDLRAEQAAAVEGRARAVGVKAAAPLGLCLLPAFVLVGVVPLVAGAVALFLGH